jgi:acyl-CoA synthetase (AMP-forming)/AMP-acid ligase II
VPGPRGRGYYNRPRENAEAFTADGGLRTGDLGFFEEDGYLVITGRIKFWSLANEKPRRRTSSRVMRARMATPLHVPACAGPFAARTLHARSI